ncbi:MAG: helix-turn-helix transcriptional regulator [Clostridia bacterium]|nr:helix-turn-helix transcriptional regulator [Clostridia bacterium]
MNFDSLHYIYAGKFTSRGQWIHPTRVIDSHEIIIVTEGSFTLMEGGRAYPLDVGSVLFLEPGVEHGGVEVTDEKISFYWLHFNGLDPVGEGLCAKHYILREPYHVSLLCRQLLHYAGEGFEQEVLDSLLHVLLCELSSQSRQDDESEGSLVLRIREWIRINADRPLNAPDVSAHFGYNEDYITRLFKKRYGIGLKSMINELKLNHVKRLLLETDLPLTEIAGQAGFSDYKLFLKFFKYHEGLTPSEFKAAYYSLHTNNH